MLKTNLVRKFDVDQLGVYVYETEDAMGRADAYAITERIKELARDKEEINMVFAPAASHYAVFKHLFTFDNVPWEKVNAFHLDEYVGLKDDAPQRIVNFAKKNIFSKAPFKSIHTMNSDIRDIDEECTRYTADLKNHPLDIAVIGIGQNGHLAYNEPHVSDFKDPLWVKKVLIDAKSINQAAEKDSIFVKEDEVPRIAMTMTIPAIMSAKHVYVAVPRVHKKAAVKETLCGEIIDSNPASILRQHPNAYLFLDKDSSAEL